MLPIVLLSVFGIVNLFLGFLRSNRVLMPFVLVVLALIFGLNLLDWNHAGSLNGLFDSPYISQMLTVDNYSVAFSGIVLLTALLLLPFSRSYVAAGEPNLAEYYSLLLFSLVGAIMMVSYNHLIMLFVGIEILSISTYVPTKRPSSTSCKAPLLPAFCSSAWHCSMVLPARSSLQT
jgi:NADH-quinone oxidoreductase subunit N